MRFYTPEEPVGSELVVLWDDATVLVLFRRSKSPHDAVDRVPMGLARMVRTSERGGMRLGLGLGLRLRLGYDYDYDYDYD